jgi:hypothetical protein
MRCAQHPEQEAVAICPACGRGTCAACAAREDGRVHCPAHRVDDPALLHMWHLLTAARQRLQRQMMGAFFGAFCLLILFVGAFGLYDWWREFAGSGDTDMLIASWAAIVLGAIGVIVSAIAAFGNAGDEN